MRRVALTAALVGASVVSSLVVYSQAAWAGTLHNGWNYAIDSFNDGTTGNKIGERSKFEFYGMAMKQTRNDVYFAFNSNLSLDGYRAVNKALNDNVSYGDLFINFANQNSVREANGSLHAIRFSDINDSEVDTGVYSNVTGEGLMTQNLGYADLYSYRNKVEGLRDKVTKEMGRVSFGDLDRETAYFNDDDGATLNASAIGYTNIDAGNGETREGDVEMLDDLSRLGLDFENFGVDGDHTFAFRVDRDSLSTGDFIAHLFAECDNDGMALAGTLVDVPEPSAMLSLALVGLVGAGYRRHKGAKDQAN